MTIEQYIKSAAPALGHRILIAPNIASKKLNSCTCYIADNISGDYILMFGDATLLGKGTIGFAFSGDTLYFANNKGEKTFILLKNIQQATYIPKKYDRCDSRYEVGDKVAIKTRNGSQVYLEGCLIGFDCEAIAMILNGVVDQVNKGVIPVSTRQNVTLAEMPQKFKLLYLKLLCNYAYIGDGVIDSDEYSVIQSIIVRIELDSEGRVKLRQYMSDIEHKDKTGDLLYRIHNELESGSYDILRYSLLQDTIYLHKIVDPDKPWYDDKFIGSLINYLKISPQQLELMESAIDLYRQMIADDKDIYRLQNRSKTLVKEALELHVPLVTLYCSGSPYSVDTYNKLFSNNDKAQVAIDKQRELMLQAVIRNSQKMLNNMIKDMNSVSRQLIDGIQRGSLATEKINKLSALLGRLSSGATKTVQKAEGTEQQILYSQLPSVLDMVIFQKTRKGEVNKEQCEYVLASYPSDEMSQQRHIKKNMSVDNLNKQIRTMKEIFYPLKGDDENEQKHY